MGKLKAQLRESYFNPILQILPALTFIVTNYIWGRETGWWCAVIVTIALTFYVNIAYKGLFKWYMFHMLIFFVVVSFMCVTAQLFNGTAINKIIDKTIFLLSLTILSVFRKKIVRLSDKLVSPLVPMSNNITEFYNIVHVFIVLTSLYIIAYLLFFFIGSGQVSADFEVINFISVVFIVLLIVFYVVKIEFVRRQLAKERWLPILNKKGKIIGTIQRLSSLSDRRKYTHPVVRGILIKDGRLLLQKPVDTNDFFYKPSWDSFINNHVGIGERTEECLKKTASELFGIKDINLFLLTKYIEDTPYEHQYVFVFIICSYSGEITPNPLHIAQSKWWTQPQIEANLQAGIFSKKFIREYSLLKRSGLLDSTQIGH